MKKHEKVFIGIFIISIILNGVFIGLYINSGIDNREIIRERDELRIRDNENNATIAGQIKTITDQKKSIDRIKNRQNDAERRDKVFVLNESKIRDIDEEITEGLEGLAGPNQENLEILRQIIESTKAK